MQPIDQTCYYYISPQASFTGHVAAFDLDWTLIRPASSKFPRDSQDIVFLSNRLPVLLDFQSKGYTIVIFTNQKVSNRYSLQFRLEYLNNVIDLLESHQIHPMIMAALADDLYRKPQTGMWQSLFKSSLIQSAFYVGDAAGRPQDFSDSDKQFAEALGISFYTPEEIFQH